MNPAPRYALLKPDSLETVGYAYGKASSGVHRGQVDVERVPSGRWKDLGEYSTKKEDTEVELRTVTKEEALSGIGTFVGSAVCMARVLPGKPKVWDYGVVVGYSWNQTSGNGTLQVTFSTETVEVEFREDEIQDLALETYALRPCLMRGTLDIMSAEMRSVQVAVHDHFNGIGQAARRSSTTVLKKVSMTPIDESQSIPVFDLEETRVVYLPIKHIVNYVLYREGKRRAPQGVAVPEELITSVVETRDVTRSPGEPSQLRDEERMEQLEDSDDDLIPVDVDRGEQNQSVLHKKKRDRDVQADVQSGDSRLLALRRRLEDDPEMVRDIDQVIAFRQANLSKGSPSTMVSAPTSDSKSQFRPSRQQVTVNDAMINGKYASLEAQLFCDTVQSHAKENGVLPHLAASRGFYGWDFGYRGLSAMHFAPMDVEEEREFLRRHDITDFSGKNKLPAPLKATEIADIMAALETLSVLAAEVYNTTVVDLVNSARHFLLSLRKIKTMRGPEAVPELVAWIDDRFECFRTCLARGDYEEASNIKNHFQFSHESYARVVHRVTSLRVDAALKPSAAKPPVQTTDERYSI